MEAIVSIGFTSNSAIWRGAESIKEGGTEQRGDDPYRDLLRGNHGTGSGISEQQQTGPTQKREGNETAIIAAPEQTDDMWNNEADEANDAGVSDRSGGCQGGGNDGQPAYPGNGHAQLAGLFFTKTAVR